MPPIPELPQRRKSSEAASRRPSRKPSRESQPAELPLGGWLAGFVLGGVISLAVVVWLSWATAHSRSFVPSARALARNDLAGSVGLIATFNENFQANRLIEQPSMRLASTIMAFFAAITAGDKAGIRTSAESLVRVDIEQEQTDAQAKWYETQRGVSYPLMKPGNRLRYTWLLRSACLTGEWQQAVQLGREGLNAADSFWARVGGVPADTSRPFFQSAVTPNAVKASERSMRACLAWALAQEQEFDAALAEINTLLAEPLAWQDTYFYVRPEIVFLRAAIEWKQGQLETARQSFQEAQQLYLTPVVFDAGRTQTGASPQLAQPRWNTISGVRATTVWESWQLLRAKEFGFSQNRLVKNAKFIWSLDPNPRDLTDDFLDQVLSRDQNLPPALTP